MSNLTLVPKGAQSLDRGWTLAAIEAELDCIASMPDHKVNKSGSSFSVSLIKLASVIKGTGSPHVKPSRVLDQVKYTCRVYPWLAGREIDRQWKRALQRAVPRYRDPRLEPQLKQRGAGYASYHLGRCHAIVHDESFVVAIDYPRSLTLKKFDLNNARFSDTRLLRPEWADPIRLLVRDVFLCYLAHVTYDSVSICRSGAAVRVARSWPDSVEIGINFRKPYNESFADVIAVLEFFFSSYVVHEMTTPHGHECWLRLKF